MRRSSRTAVRDLSGVVIDTSSEFAAELDALRKNAGKTYRQLAAECGVGFTTIAGWCSGRHLPQVSLRAQFGQLLRALGVDSTAELKRWFDAVVRLRGADGPSTPARNPYPGLRAFQESDSTWFFGREELVDRLVAALDDAPEDRGRLLVVGPSGSGKSSLLRAGLMPRRPASVVVTPGRDPVASWQNDVGSSPDGTLVVVDQFEEVFTLCHDRNERDRFLATLLDHRGPLVIGMRADFYSRALGESRLIALAGRCQFVVGPMAEPQYRAAIAKPAEAAGIELADGLVELLVRDAVREPAALPMLSHTLHTLVEVAVTGRDGPAAIGIKHYREVGGVAGAVAQTAEAAYASLNTEQGELARRLFLRLVSTAAGATPTRRQVGVTELFDGLARAEADDLAQVLDLFVTARLLTAGENTFEIGHEALLQVWPRLREWLADEQVEHHVHSKLTAAAMLWHAEGRPAELTYRGALLETAMEWAARPGHRSMLNVLERDFLAGSCQLRDTARTAERRRVRHRYQLLCLLLVLALVATGAWWYANDRATAADEASRVALARHAAATADRLSERDPALAAQIALAAYRTAPTPETTSTLLDSSARPVPRRVRTGVGAGVAMARGADLVVVGGDGDHVRLLRRRAPDRLDVHGAGIPVARAVTAVAVTPDDRRVAVADDTGTVSMWDVTDVDHPVAVTQQVVSASGVTSMEFDRDGGLLVIGTGSGVVIGQMSGPGSFHPLRGATGRFRAVAFAPGAPLVAAGGDDGSVHLWDVATPAASRPLAVLRGPAGKVLDVAFSGDGRSLAAGIGADHNVYLWDVRDPAGPRSKGPPLTGPASWVHSVAFAPDDATLAAGSADTGLWQWDLRTRQVVATLPHPISVLVVDYWDDHVLASLAGDGTARTWTVPGPLLPGSTNQVFSASYDRSGRHLLVGAGDDVLRLWEVADPRRRRLAAPTVPNDSTEHGTLAGASAVAPDSRTVFAGSTTGHLHGWAVHDAEATRTGTPTKVADDLVEAIAYHPAGRFLAFTSDDGLVRLADVSRPSAPRVVTTVATHAGPTYGVRFSPDGRLLAFTTETRGGFVFDVSDPDHPRQVARATGFRGAVYTAAFNRDSTMVAFAGADYTTHVVDLTTPGTPRTLTDPLTGPVSEIYDVAFNPTRDDLAVSSIDGTIRVWDLAERTAPVLRATLSAASDGLFTVSYSPDGRTLVGAGRDPTVRLWMTDAAEVARWVCATSGDGITAAEWDQFVPGLPFHPPCR